MWNMMNGICGINGMLPFQGLNWLDDLFRRALPYANDDWAFSPFRPFVPSRLRAFALSETERSRSFAPFASFNHLSNKNN